MTDISNADGTIDSSADTSGSVSIQVDQDLDVIGLQCPMPLLKTKLALNNMNPGEILKVAATDPGSEKDFHLFADQSNHQILNFLKEDSAYFYWIKRGT